MENNVRIRRKGKSIDDETYQSERPRRNENSTAHLQDVNSKVGKVKKILVRNFMCHDAMEVILNPNVNFIVGCNGSGKSAILTALTVGLGARANVTSRGASVKGFIKKGKQSATIEVTLLNQGPMAYKPDVYGESIIILRTISNSSAYKIKNCRGEVISTKRNELDNILRAMNIQIDNPICILNQDISRTFLVSSKPEEKYEFFMKATLLDVIGNNYKESESICQGEYVKLQQYNEILLEVRKEIEILKANIKRAEEIDKLREEATGFEKELVWAVAIAEEQKLQRVEEVLNKCKDAYQYLVDDGTCADSKDEEINKKILDLEEEIKEAEREVTNSSEDYNKVKQEYSISKDTYYTKAREWRSSQSKIKRFEDDINMIKEEIQRQETCDNTEQSERKQMKQQLADLEQKLDEIEALLRTKRTHQTHLETDKLRLLQEMHATKIEIANRDNRIKQIERDIHATKKQSDDALTVFGRNIPRLLRRIDEEYNNNQFREKPRGPFGAYIKMKDPAWVPAVENYLGVGTFSTFCVDNSDDVKLLTAIMKEIYLNERIPQIICSKFYNKVHDVRAHCTRSPDYSNLLDAMDISDPIVANSLIDQREIECVLLIPTSKEAADIMSDGSKVPHNCKRAFTQAGDLFYPDPDYRSYGGPRNLRARFLQVSVSDAIKGLEEELRALDNEKKAAVQSYTTAHEKEKRTSSELITANQSIAKLNAAHNQCKAQINDLKDEIETKEAISVTVFKDELNELEKQLHQEKCEESRLSETVQELQKKVEHLETEIRRYRELRQNLDLKVNPLKASIKQLRDQKTQMREKARHAMGKLEGARHALQSATAEFEIQQRATVKAVSDATNRCDRIETSRSAKELGRLATDLKAQIREIERQFGTIEQFRKKLKAKEAKYGKNLNLTSKIEKTYQAHLKRLQERKILFSDMREAYGIKIQNSFSNVLALRNKKGTINIDHRRKVLTLEMNSQNDSQGSSNDARSLSGGERSYSTVAFILALWDCTNLPFYFLDEFDVFMDKVNRRIIMDILLDHTKTHPHSQFMFLTPLDTSNILAEDYVTIHRMAPPERGNRD